MFVKKLLCAQSSDQVWLVEEQELEVRCLPMTGDKTCMARKRGGRLLSLLLLFL